jgi:hypothetical protein
LYQGSVSYAPSFIPAGSTTPTTPVYHFSDSSGSYTLDATGVAVGDVVYSADEMMILDLAGTYPRLILNIDEADSISCSLFHNEDDAPHKMWAATDSGNGYAARWVAAGYSTCTSSSDDCPNTFVMENHTGSSTVALQRWAGYTIVCVQ